MFYLSFDVLIPALNEEEAIGQVLAPLARFRDEETLFGSRYRLRRLWVVDNGSEDATASIAKEFGAEVIFEPVRGYGRACLSGIDAMSDAPPDALLFVDADGSDDLTELDLLITQLTSPITSNHPRIRPVIGSSLMGHALPAQLVIGSRARFAVEGALTPLQRFGNWLSCRLLKSIFNVRFTDLGPLRIIRWEALSRLKMRDQDFGWTVEMQAKAAALQIETAEVDVHYLQRYAGESKISGTLIGSCRAGVKILLTIAKAWLSAGRGTTP